MRVQYSLQYITIKKMSFCLPLPEVLINEIHGYRGITPTREMFNGVVRQLNKYLVEMLIHHPNFRHTTKWAVQRGRSVFPLCDWDERCRCQIFKIWTFKQHRCYTTFKIINGEYTQVKNADGKF